MTVGVTARATGLDLPTLDSDDSLGAQTRDAAVDEALNDHRVGEKPHFGVGDFQRSEERHALLRLQPPRDRASFPCRKSAESDAPGALDSDR
jgi:hypothetical protein